MQKILLVGSGGREHALALALARSPSCGELLAAPGNPGIASVARCVAVKSDDVEELVSLAVREAVDLVVVGPEAPLVAGLVDRLSNAGIATLGPTAAAARLEGSKGFLKDLCARHGIPTAAYARFTDAEAARAYVREKGAPIVVKVDGLAAGKGVTVATTVDEALHAVDEALVEKRFGEAGRALVVEACLVGEELSFFALCDGTRAVALASARDHKRLLDSDEGPNTGGMGAVAPHPRASDALHAELLARFITPTLDAMRAEGAPFAGVLYAGVMLTAEGPMLLEYNVRLGDPECQCLVARLGGDVAEALSAAARGRLDAVSLTIAHPAAACVVLAAPGYPSAPRTGDALPMVDTVSMPEGVTLLHAGTARGDDGVLRSAGGRVLNVVGVGRDHAEAVTRAYEGVKRLNLASLQYRHDIGERAI